jgi:hypothetical protein
LDIKQKKSGASESGDPLADGVVKMKEFFSKNGTFVVVVISAVVVLVGGGLIFHNMKETNIRKAQEVFGIGILDYNADNIELAHVSFAQVANDFGNTPLGTMSAFMLGSINLQQNNVDQAITWFETAVNGTEAGFIRGQALEGLAAAYEERGDNAAAIRNLERALRDKNVAHRHAAIRWRLALLTKENDVNTATRLCREIIADTLAAAFHQRAENLLAAVSAR